MTRDDQHMGRGIRRAGMMALAMLAPVAVSAPALADHQPPLNEPIFYNGTLTSGVPDTGFIGFDGKETDDYDWYCFNVFAGQEVTITVVKLSGDLRPNTGVLFGAAPDGTPRGTLPEIGHTSNSTMDPAVFTFTPVFSGPVTIWVSRWLDPDSGDYQVTQTGGTETAGECGEGIALGACCLAEGACQQSSQEVCGFLGGQFLGDGTGCVPYTFTLCANAFEDISASAGATQLVLGDDEGQVVPLGFSFSFFGISHTDIGVASNGYLSFGAVLNDFTDETIPSINPPNDLIAVLWTDLNPGEGGTIHYETRGAAPNRRFIAQWTAVPRFFDEGANTFQALLFEGSNCIELRYGPFDPSGGGKGGGEFTKGGEGGPEGGGGGGQGCDFVTGIEDPVGITGINVDCATIQPGTCLQFCPEQSPCGVAQAPTRANTAQKGSMLVWPDVSLRFVGPPGPEGPGIVHTDTIISLINDKSSGSVRVKLYFVNGDMAIPPFGPGAGSIEPGWNFFDNVIELTHDEPVYWSLLTGKKANGEVVVSPFLALDPNGRPNTPTIGGLANPAFDPTLPLGATERVLRGFIVGFAIDAFGQLLSWNHLSGSATVVDYLNNEAYQYSPWRFRANFPNTIPGNVLPLNGQPNGYDACPEFLILDFFRPGSPAFGPNAGGTPSAIATWASLTPMVMDFTPAAPQEPIPTSAQIDVWNEDEVKLTNLHRCVQCWDSALLSAYATPNHFVLLGTEKGKARFKGEFNPACERPANPNASPPDPGLLSQSFPLIGSSQKVVSWGAAIGRAGEPMSGAGARVDGSIRFVQQVDPPEANGGGRDGRAAGASTSASKMDSARSPAKAQSSQSSGGKR